MPAHDNRSKPSGKDTALETRAPGRVRARPGTVASILRQPREVTVETVREGLPVESLEGLAERLQVTSAALQRWLNLSRQTYARRRAKGCLSADESDRVVRYADLFRQATDLLGDESAAAQWLRTPAPALGGETPMDHATTEFGARDVTRLIGRLEHGIPT